MATLDELTERLARSLAKAKEQGDALKAGVDDNLQALIRAQLDRLDVVTREEFAAQQALLHKASQRLDSLEAEVARLRAIVEQQNTEE
ncbi:accessory factor UbiK family protein [Natronospirillum operosum]|uniref:Accessory factor UbiK family protein n=1 Tax=Natronospirillum operosum TaxID=2759953 RepID=A0A4Z0W5T1_9GAMM|nr:accessory factor UbiK family protein [Natronospirillum operosum]TGG91354.1 accessory factor UbiK family protein [Natronospirillum operosum]